MRLYCIFGLLFIAGYSISQDDDCKCVFYYLCTRNDTIITDGRTIIDERFGAKCECECPTKGHVCCRLITNQTTSATTSSSTPPTVSTVGDRDSSDKTPKCGITNPDGIGYKLGNDAEEVAFGEFPWMVGILIDGGNYRCGGSLIHPSVVLTAAHCVVKNQTYTARAGEWDSSNTKEILDHQDREVSSIKIHEDYMPGIYYNDVALLFLESPFKMGEHINVACLPKPDTVADNEECYATGWGKDKFGGEGKYPAILKKVLLPIVNHDKCQENFRQTRLGQYFVLNKSFVCAGGKKGKDTCIGDGGGPLVCPISGEDDRYQQIGITSWGIGCNEENVPGAYASLPFLRSWIDKQMTEKKLETDLYQF